MRPSSEQSLRAPDDRVPTLEEAFDAAVRTHYARLGRYAFRILASWDAAEDAVQQALFKCWARRGAIDLGDPLAYFYMAVRNECLMVVRRERRFPTSDEIPPVAAQPADCRVEQLEADVTRAIDALPDRCRQVFTMSREQRLTYAQIADLLGVSIKTVETQMGRALKSLRRALADYLTS